VFVVSAHVDWMRVLEFFFVFCFLFLFFFFKKKGKGLKMIVSFLLILTEIFFCFNRNVFCVLPLKQDYYVFCAILFFLS
jgi:hypothetical protein